MDNANLNRLLEGAAALSIPLAEPEAKTLLRFLDELLKWNQKVNLTAVTSPGEAIERHLLDSLALLPELTAVSSLLDVGAGAGLPGIPIKVMRPELKLTLVDSVGKKVAFMKHVVAQLALGPGAQALHVRAQGKPEQEGIRPVDAAVSRAVAALPEWAAQARPYVRPGGLILSMLGKAPDRSELDAAQAAAGRSMRSIRAYRLPFSGAERHIVTFA